MLQQPSLLFEAAAIAVVWLMLLSLNRSQNQNRSRSHVLWSAAWWGVADLTKAFDPAGHISLRSQVIIWGGLAVLAAMVVRSARAGGRGTNRTVKGPEQPAA